MAIATYNDSGDTYEDVDFLYDGLDPAQSTTILIGTPAAATDVTDLVDWDSWEATDNGGSGVSTVVMRLFAALSTLTTVTDQALIKIVDHSLNTETHRAFITSRKPVGTPRNNAITDIVAVGIESLLDDSFIPLEVMPAGGTVSGNIKVLWRAYRPPYLDNSETLITGGGVLPAQTFAGVTLREAIEQVLAQGPSTGYYYVNSLGQLVVTTSAGAAAPFNIDNDAPTGGEVAAETLEVEYDSKSYANSVYVQGGTPEGSGLFRDETAIAAAGGLVREKAIQAPDCTTAAMAAAMAAMYLGRVKTGIARGVFTISGVDGWRAGQNVLITDANKGLSAVAFRIARVTTRLQKPGTTPRFHYTVEFGGSAAGAGGSGASSQGQAPQLVYGNLGGQSRVFVTADGVTVTDGN